MIDVDQSPACDRKIDVRAQWNATRTDFVPAAAQIASHIREHDDRFHSNLGDGIDTHLLFGRWVRLGPRLRPFSLLPFQLVGQTCRDIGLGLTVSVEIGLSKTEKNNLLDMASSGIATALSVHLPKTESNDNEICDVIDELAGYPIGLELCGDMVRYRSMGVTRLKSLSLRQHRFVPGQSSAQLT
jgi:hypothetical protein